MRIMKVYWCEDHKSYLWFHRFLKNWTCPVCGGQLRLFDLVNVHLNDRILAARRCLDFRMNPR